MFTELQRTFKEFEVLLTQFCEEKVQLAQKALDLIAMHQTDLDAVSKSGGHVTADKKINMHTSNA